MAKNKCSNGPQQISEEAWYYEYPSHIEVLFASVGKPVAAIIRIPRRKLEASLKRMNASRRKR